MSIHNVGTTLGVTPALTRVCFRSHLECNRMSGLRLRCYGLNCIAHLNEPFAAKEYEAAGTLIVRIFDEPKENVRNFLWGFVFYKRIWFGMFHSKEGVR